MSERNADRAAAESSAPKRDLAERLFEFAVVVVKLTQRLPGSFAGRHVGRQLLKSGTSAGANYEESQAAESRDDFVHKLQVALKELREANFWLRLIARTGIAKGDGLETMVDESRQLVAMLSKAVATAKGKSKRGPRLSSWFFTFALCLLTFAFCLLLRIN